MTNSGKPQHYLLRGMSGSDAYSRTSSASALRNCMGVPDDPFEKKLISATSKSEMVNEIIILKESNNKLLKALVQKERECREFQDHLIVSSKTNADLMDELSDLTLENQRLKLKGITFLEENRALYGQICQLKKMYSKALNQSYHPGENSRKLNHHQNVKQNAKDSCKFESDEPTESWEEISQKLLTQMQEEMMELENLNTKYFDSNKVMASQEYFKAPLSSNAEGETSDNSNNPNLVPSSVAFSDECELLCAKSLIHHLKSQVEHLKNHMLSQKMVLKATMEQLQKFTKAFGNLTTSPMQDMARESPALSTASKRLSQPSDELFRAYFTKQLHNGVNSNSNIGGNPNEQGAVAEIPPLFEPSAPTKIIDIPKKVRVKEQILSEPETKDTTLKAHEEATQEGDDDDDQKICPICERKFPARVTQTEFEDHVFEHLDSKNILEH